MSPPVFAYPEGLHFTCSRCGDCCRGWNVALGPGEPESLRELDWKDKVPELVDVAPGTKFGPKYALTRKEDGSCIYLGKENQCLIHEHFGVLRKPLMCRLFPFGFLPVGDRVAVDVSFACKAVSEDRGAPLRERLPEWVCLLQGPPAQETGHAFSKKYRIEGELLWELEHGIVRLLSDPQETFLERIRAVSEFMRLAMTADPRTDAARRLREVMLAGVPKQLKERPIDLEPMNKTQRAVFFHLLFLMLNPTPPDLLGRSDTRASHDRVKAADAYRFRGNRPWIDNRVASATFGEIETVALGYLAEEGGRGEVERFLQAKIVGQRFLREGESEIPFVAAVPRLLLVYPMLLWTAKAFAAGDARRAVSREDARRALRLLDRSYGSVPLSALPSKQRKAWEFIIGETDLPFVASVEMSASDPS
ncbi:MAG TPA: YkgJ family cysteine cluster protein [Vicinamibacteria bacterium]|nr:YkgJ family cysteine cluster protein [Vicinamibacteria bacterium]